MTIARSCGLSFSSTNSVMACADAIGARPGADVKLVEEEREHARARFFRGALFVRFGFDRRHVAGGARQRAKLDRLKRRATPFSSSSKSDGRRSRMGRPCASVTTASMRTRGVSPSVFAAGCC